ncbi:hypothetical protein [Cardinium endosymbiont of Tipula unca]|uniref:hypothetical protein n=1 Tax=Cardinium endosymbiont of Tipula unca TaxID=3066216 RepID=UPI0030D0E922
MLFCSIKGANRGYIQVLLATSRNRIYFRRRSIIMYHRLPYWIGCFYCVSTTLHAYWWRKGKIVQ